MNQDESEETKVTVEKPDQSNDDWYVRHFPALMGIVFVLMFAILILLGRD